MVFLSPDPEAAESARREVEKALQSQGLSAAGWRKVPTDDSALGAEALRSKPMIEQLFINAQNVRDSSDFECKLYQARRRAEIDWSRRCHLLYLQPIKPGLAL